MPKNEGASKSDRPTLVVLQPGEGETPEMLALVAGVQLHVDLVLVPEVQGGGLPAAKGRRPALGALEGVVIDYLAIEDSDHDDEGSHFLCLRFCAYSHFLVSTVLVPTKLLPTLGCLLFFCPHL